MATVNLRDTNQTLTDAGEIRAFLAPFGIWYRRFEGSDQLGKRDGPTLTEGEGKSFQGDRDRLVTVALHGGPDPIRGAVGARPNDDAIVFNLSQGQDDLSGCARQPRAHCSVAVRVLESKPGSVEPRFSYAAAAWS